MLVGEAVLVADGAGPLCQQTAAVAPHSRAADCRNSRGRTTVDTRINCTLVGRWHMLLLLRVCGCGGNPSRVAL